MFLPAFASAWAIAFTPATFQDPPPSPPAAPAVTRYDFPTNLAPGESRLIEIRTTTSSTFHLELDSHATDTKERAESTTWIVDTLLDPATQPKGRTWSGRRRFVKAQATKDGVVDDPETNGLEAELWSDQQLHFKCASDRMVSQSTLDDLVLSTETLGLGAGIRLPRGAAIGDEYKMLVGSLAPWCLTTEGRTPTATAQLRLESVDAKKNVALFKGPLHVEEFLEKTAEQADALFGIKGTGAYDGELAIEYDLAAHHIARIVCHAKAVMQGETVGKVAGKFGGTNVIETTITCSSGAAAGAALNQKTQFRDVPHECPEAGVSIALPSHFSKFALTAKGCRGFRTLLQGKDRYETVVVVPLVRPGMSLKEAGELAWKEIAGIAGAKVKGATATGSLGAAIACEYTSDNSHGLNAVFQLEPGRYVILQCSCVEALWPEWSKEFPKFFQNLKKVSAAK